MSTTKVKKYKLCRRLGSGIFEKCQTQKFITSQPATAKRGPVRRTDFANQMLEKQKVRFTYGVREKQFGNYVKHGMEHAKKGVSAADLLFRQLESRLDNVVYRMGFATSRALARQMVSHGHITVNGRKLNIPSSQLREKDVVSIREGSKTSVLFQDLAAKLKNHKTPEWIKWNGTTLSGEIVGTPKQPDPFLQFQAVIEFYSR